MFGKKIENLRKRRNILICNTPVRAEKIVASPLYTEYKIFDENLAPVERGKGSNLINRPVYVGFTILEFAELLMHQFHYNHIKTCKEKAQLLFTDTDSLTYHIATPNIHEDMNKNQHSFDTSNYPHDHPLFSIANKKVTGNFKDELNGRYIFEILGSKAKMYSIISEDGEKRRQRGF